MFDYRFYGDSVTDSYRGYDTAGLGEGYVRFAAETAYIPAEKVHNEGCEEETLAGICEKITALPPSPSVITLQLPFPELIAPGKRESIDEYLAPLGSLSASERHICLLDPLLFAPLLPEEAIPALRSFAEKLKKFSGDNSYIFIEAPGAGDPAGDPHRKAAGQWVRNLRPLGLLP